MAVDIKSYNEILGEMVRKVIADSPVNDVNTGSVLLTLLEAAAQIDFENNASVLNILELLSIDATRNNDLDSRGADFGLNRTPARRATGFVTITDTNITKKSTGLYQVKLPPIAGSTQIFVNDASDWTTLSLPVGIPVVVAGNLFIGRGTPNFEGPIPYTTITNNTTFYTIGLGVALEKDHLISDTVIDGQGTTDRLIVAGTSVQIPANNQNPAIEYEILRDAVIPAGEDTVGNVDIIATSSGTQSNAGINTITTFISDPFPGAAVSNTTPLTSGLDVESDDEYRERIKSFSSTLARGTKQAILSSVIGVSDPDDGKQVVSAVITEPPSIGDPSILYLDDGSGFEPSFTGQSVDILLNEATGNEEFLQLANFPLPRPQTINTVEGPYEITEQMQLRVLVDGIEESILFTASQFRNIAAATISEIIIVINDQAQSFRATFTANSSRILLFPLNHEAETIQVSALTPGEDSSLFANNVLKFPTNEFSYIRLYQNRTLLNERERAATLLTNLFSTWSIVGNGNIIIEVDGTPPQNRTFTTSDFGGSPFPTLEVGDWVTAFNNKFAGITATATSSGRMQIVSNREGNSSSLKVIGGSYSDSIFGDQNTEVTGRNSDFQLNRQTGNVRILTDIESGDSIAAGTEDAKGSVTSATTPTGVYNVGTDSNSRPANLIVVADSKEVVLRVGVGIAIGNTITVTDEGSDTMRLTSDSISAFNTVLAGDYLFIANRGALSPWIDPANTGLFKIISKGEHSPTTPSTFYIEVKNVNIVPGAHVVEASEDIQAFSASSYPQLWKGSFLVTPASAAVQDIVDSIDENLVNVDASIFKTNAIQITSNTEENGTIATAAGSGNALALFPLAGHQTGNESHIANRTANKDFIAYFKRTTPTSVDADGVTGKTVWLDRVTYSDINGSFTDSIEPGEDGVDTYSEELESTGVLLQPLVDYSDIVNFLDGSNKGQYRAIRDILIGDKVGTQHALPRTLMDVSAGEEFNLMRPLSISPDDSIVFILDQDAVAKTIDVRMSRTGQINSDFPPTTLSFSADDADNEPGITFGNLQVWGKATNGTEFEDYAVWFRARNWYVSGGAGSGGGALMIRASEYGPHGENIQFQIEYPETSDEDNSIFHVNNPDYSRVTYVFGSGPEKPIGETSGDTIAITDVSGSYPTYPAGTVFRYTFNNTLALGSVIAGDILSVQAGSGLTAANSGVFSLLAVDDSSDYVELYNPNGATTFVGTQEVTQVDTVDDILGTPEIYSVDVNGLGGAAVDGLYFIIEDTAGTVAIWFDTDDNGTPEPAHGAARSIEINPAAAATSSTVATLIAAAITSDSEFSSSSGGDVVTITNLSNGNLGALNLGTSGFLDNGGTNGSPDTSLDGTYFILQDQNGSVAFWYDTSGITPVPLHGADRAIEITTVLSGDSAATVATKTAVFIVADAQFVSATVSTNEITVTDVTNGVRPAASAGTTGFTVTEVTPGVDDIFETIITPTAFSMYSLTGTAVTDIVSKVTESPLLVAALIDGTSPITLATRDEVYTPVGPADFSASLSYDHDPDPISTKNDYIILVDSQSWIKDFNNLDPHFTLKRDMVLHGEAPLAYSVDTTPNEDGSTGEYFKLTPVTLNNTLHHFTQKALSQLPIVSDISISNAIRRIQIKSKLLGSQGAVEVVGGNGNDIEYSIFGEAQVTPGPVSGGNFLQVKTRALPVALTTGDIVEVQNTKSVKRKSRLGSSDSIDVVRGGGNDTEYKWNHKDTALSSVVRFTIADVSATYVRPAGTVWRWTHNDGGSYFNITDDTVGVIVGASPSDQLEDDSVDAPALEIDTVDAGTASTAQNFRLTVNALPNQADYYYFENQAGTVSFAVWFDIDAAGTTPTGALYTGATHQIEVDILSSDTEDAIVSALAITLLGNVDFLSEFGGIQEQGANLDDVVEGDLLVAWGTFPATWNSGNKAKLNGSGAVAGLPIIAVNAASRWVDVVNSDGVAMTDEFIGTGNVDITPSPIVKWDLAHAAKAQVVQGTLVGSPGGTVTLQTASPHKLREGDTFTLSDNGLAQSTTVLSVVDPQTITFTDTLGTTPDAVFPAGNIINSSKTTTRYKIESIGFNDLYRLSYVDGEAPRFVDNGIAVDDVMVIQGTTFANNNSGEFRVLAVDNASIIYQNEVAVEELNTIIPFNNLELTATWTSNVDEVTGLAGTFKNLSIGDWIKKPEDDETLFVQVTALLDAGGLPVASTLATRVVIGKNYEGTSSTSVGIALDQNSGIGTGNYLQSVNDIEFFEGDSVRIGDKIFVDDIANPNWFSSQNSGTFEITQIGTDSGYRPFVRIENAAGLTESNQLIFVAPLGYFILEGDSNLYKSVRVIEHSVIDSFNQDRRQLYMSPPTRVDKMSQANGTKIVPIGKLDYSKDIVTGIDGYTYYTGLLRTVQRIVDGFEPDPVSYPGRRAIGGIIESLPPLIRRVIVSIEATTNEGVNLNEISNDIKSAIITYIDNLGVGEDVILSEMIVAVMDITGVEAVTFSIPSPSTERISIADNEKAFIEPDDISVA